jgi:hypothetical protein
MYVKKFTINSKSLGSNYFYLPIPAQTEFQIVDNYEVIEEIFVKEQVETSINPISDYEKTRFSPVNSNGNPINTVIYNFNFLNSSNSYSSFYSDINFTNEELSNRKNSFIYSSVDLLFYDTDNPLTQRLVNKININCLLNSIDFDKDGRVKPANQIQVKFILTNPLVVKNGISNGYFIYDFKNQIAINESKDLYMKAVFKNAKNGKTLNMMVKNSPQYIDKLVKELYTKYKIIRTNTGFKYYIDSTYQGNGTALPNNNVSYNNETVIVNLYQINAL